MEQASAAEKQFIDQSTQILHKLNRITLYNLIQWWWYWHGCIGVDDDDDIDQMWASSI